MAIDMRKTPSYLKGLAETRARADGEVLRLKALYDELDEKLAEARRIQALLDDVARKMGEAVSRRDACDKLIRDFDDRLDPNLIAPIRAWKNRYGKRGELKTAIERILQKIAPSEITTPELCLTLIAEFALDFSTKTERQKWAHNSVGNALKDLVEAGIVERLHEPVARAGKIGRWRLKDHTIAGTAGLLEAATASGLTVSQAKRRGRPAKLKEPTLTA
ncbi:MAG: hypothetical protein B7X93_09685 [Hydrogenophilales bacterium 17-61-9]|nr:MAG: hypothetical protein B7X93_09685 [Hydrogenophilales bacterium 17-61-9]